MPSQIFAENGTAWQRKECCQRMVGVFHGTTIAWRHHNGAPSEPIDNDWRLRASTLNRSDQGLNLRVNHQYISPLRYLLISFCFNLADVWALDAANRNGKRRPTRSLSRGNTISRSISSAMMLPPIVLPLLHVKFFERISNAPIAWQYHILWISFSLRYIDAFSFY